MKIKKWNGSIWTEVYPEVTVGSIVVSTDIDDLTGSTNEYFLRADGSWAKVEDSGNQFVNISGDTMTGDLSFTNATDIGVQNASGNSWYRPEDQYGNTHIEVRSGKGIYVDADTIALRSQANTDRLRITSAGNVGIGTTSPGEKLQVEGDVLISGSGGTMGTTGQITDAFLKVGTGLGIDPNQILFTSTSYINSVGTLALAGGGNGATSDLHITTGHDVGIGTTSPSYKLDVSGSIRAVTDSSTKIWAENTTSGQSSLELKSTTTHMRLIGQLGGFQMYDQIDGASRFEIDTSGNSKIFGNLTVQSTFPRIYLTDTDHNSDYSILNSNGSYIIYDDTNSANRFRINSSGNAVIGDANPSNIGFLEKSLEIQAGSSSDTTLKQAGLVISGSSDADDADDFAYVSFRNNHSAMSNDRVAEIRVMKNGTDVDKADMHFYTSDGSSLGARLSILNNGNVGIGDTTPSYALEVAGEMAVNKIWDRNNGSYYLDPASTSVVNALNVQTLEVEGAIYDRETDQLRMPFPKGGFYTNGSSSVTGAIEITLPSGAGGNYSMISFFVDVYDYAGGADGESFTLHLGGYVNGSTWTNTFANVVAVGRTDRFFNVRYNVDGNANKIYIAETTNSWSYPKIQIRDFMAGHSGGDDSDWYNNAFTIDITTTIDGTTAREKTLESVATWADQVDVNSSSSTSFYNVLWHSGDTVYYAANNRLRVQPSTGVLQINGNDVATESYVDTAISDLVDSSPDALNTLNELATALNNDASFSTTVTNSIATKLPLAGGTMSGSIAMANNNITGINQIEINDPGEGIVFKQGSSGDMTLKIIDDSTDNILEYSGSSAKFRVAGSLDIKSSNPLLTLEDTGTTTGTAYVDYQAGTSLKLHAGGDALTFVAGNAERARIASGGNFGIGTTSPGSKLQVSSSGTALGRFFSTGNGDSHGLYLNVNVTAGDVALDNNVHFASSGSNSGSFTFATGNDERVRIQSNGYVGIGTTSPLSTLNVHGDSGLYISTVSNNPTDGAQIRFSDHSSQAQYGFIKYKHANQTVETEPVNSDDGFIIGGSETNTVVSIQGSLNVDGETNFEDQVEIDNGDLFVRNGNLTVSSAYPRIYLTDTDSNNDFSIINGNGTFSIYDDTAGVMRMQINSSGDTTFASGAVVATDYMYAHANLLTKGNLYLNYDNNPAGADAYVYFGDDASDTAHWMRFDNSAQQFGFSNKVVGPAGRLGAIESNGNDVDKVNFSFNSSTNTLTITTTG